MHIIIIMLLTKLDKILILVKEQQQSKDIKIKI